MADPTTPNKTLATPATGADVNTWGVVLNQNLSNIDQALGTYTGLNVTGQSGNVALTVSQSIPLGFIISGTLTANVNYVTPAAAGGLWAIRNPLSANSFNVTFSSASGGPSVVIPPGENVIVSADGTASGMANAVTVLQAAAGANTQVQVNNNGLLAGYPGFVYDSGARVLTVPGFNNTGSTVLGDAAGDTTTINGTNISTPNGFNYNAGQFQMNPDGQIGIGAAPAGGALVTVGGLVYSTSGGYAFPDATTSTTAKGKILQLIQASNTSATQTGAYQGQYATGSGTVPSTAGGVHVTPFDTTFTPDSAASTLEIDLILKGTINTGDAWFVCLFNGTTLIDYQGVFPSGTASTAVLSLRTWLTPGSTTALNLKVYIGSNSNNIFYLNSYGAGTGQPSMISWLTVKELTAGN